MQPTPGRLLDDDAALRSLLATTRRIAVLGIKTEAQVDQPALYVPAYLADAGYDIVPVPVYYPEVREILGRPVVRQLSAIDSRVDLVNVFRRPADLPAHLDDVLAARPTAVWLQSGIRNDSFAQALLDAGIDVVQDRCIMVDHRRLITRPPAP